MLIRSDDASCVGGASVTAVEGITRKVSQFPYHLNVYLYMEEAYEQLLNKNRCLNKIKVNTTLEEHILQIHSFVILYTSLALNICSRYKSM
jgi:hypothetical protein